MTNFPEGLARLFEQPESTPLFATLMSALAEVLPCDRCFLYQRDPVQGQGTITHCYSKDGQADQWIGADWLEDSNAPQDPLMTIALRIPEAVFVNDVETAGANIVNLEYEREVFRHRALIHAPLYHDSLLIGILECSVFDAPRQWTEADRCIIANLQTLLAPRLKHSSQDSLAAIHHN